MKSVDPRILKFIRRHHVLTLAVAEHNIPYCAHCFYCYLPGENLFIFTSDHDTRHIRDVEKSGNYQVAAAIALETKIIGKIRGLQLTGRLLKQEGTDLVSAKAAYLKRFPVARLATLHLWALKPDFMKLTDNRLGFGTKLLWEET
jgi:uncharacterized protein YhbP (UPF0306 family)